jgi:hypothetical protein
MAQRRPAEQPAHPELREDRPAPASTQGGGGALGAPQSSMFGRARLGESARCFTPMDERPLGSLEGHVHLVPSHCPDNAETECRMGDELVHLEGHRRAIDAGGTGSSRLNLGCEAENRPRWSCLAAFLCWSARPRSTPKGMVRPAGVAPDAGDGFSDHGEDGVGKHELALPAKPIHISTDPRRHPCLRSSRALARSMK